MADQGFIDNIAGRGVQNAERRADLCSDLTDAVVQLEEATAAVCKDLEYRLEGREAGVLKLGPAGAFNSALAKYEEVRASAVIFLLREGHEGDPDLASTQSAWDAMRNINEESLADAASALREGTLTRRSFEERRAEVVQSRARFDAEVDKLVVRLGVVADA